MIRYLFNTHTGKDETISYQYDTCPGGIGQLCQLTDESGTTGYQYDAYGNLAETYQYTPASNQLTNLRTLTIGSTGPTTPNRQLIYNDASRLYQLIEDGQLKATYLYSASGQRTEKTLHHPDATTTTTLYHYDLQGRLIAETDETGTAKKETLWDDTLTPIAQIDTDVGETLSYLHTDHLMTPRLATDETQTIVWRWEGEAFGNTPAEELSGVQVNLRFPGQYFDGETNLHYNWNRYYDPQLGRYITSDPIGIQGGANTYGYVNGSPTRYTDQYGLFLTPQTIGGGVGLVVGFGYSYFVNGNNFRDAAFDGLQAGAAGFISGGGSLLAGFSASAAVSALRSKIECGKVDVGSALVDGGFAAGGGYVGKVAGAFVPRDMVRVQRGFFGRIGERVGILLPKRVDANAALRSNIGAGTAAGAENLLGGAFSDSRSCDQ